MREVPLRAQAIAVFVLIGAPILDSYDHNNGLAYSISMRTHLDEMICKQSPQDCWIKLKESDKGPNK